MTFSNGEYPFGGVVTVIAWPQGFLRVSTAKEGVFSKQSTMISVVVHPAAPVAENVVIGKIMWADALRTGDRKRAHYELIKGLNQTFDVAAEVKNIHEPLVIQKVIPMALDVAVSVLRTRGMVKEFINALKV